ncbi:MAG: DUF1614 domain-containing protein [Syntrophaceticus sp.]|nr:DUF1614 domain-containing protein [Eubacteriales bacterium]MDD3315122.1 DUF1614 domain-containing protein [Syntrophaceticus sp.]MDD4360088.1 DUF1614 domain-containing protein [Syntrophaceticus sp.]MDD4783492.1 DUF1614 domain-containing protein [Syntrophaceticus sp.]
MIPFLFLILLIPLLLLLLFFNVATFSFSRLGMSQSGAFLFLTASIIGSLINIPLSRRRVRVYNRQGNLLSMFFFYYPPAVQEQVICINVGGAGLPALLSLYLLLGGRAPLWPTLFAFIAVTIVAKMMSRPKPGVGIVMPAFIPPLVAAAAALILAPGGSTAPVAYVAGTMGTLIGADLLNWRAFQSLGGQMISIGGAGIFDGVFLVGIIAAFLG